VNRRATSVLAAVGTLVAGCALALGGAGLGAGYPAAFLLVAFLLAAPAVAVAVPLPSQDPNPLARMVLGLAAALAVNTLVAETMLVTGTWSVPGAVLTVALLSAAGWLLIGAGGARSGGTTGNGERP
jgi:hypothetical protein